MGQCQTGRHRPHETKHFDFQCDFADRLIRLILAFSIRVSHLFSPSTLTPAKSAGVFPRFMLSITEEMEKALEKERKKRMLGTIPETARVILGEYLAKLEG